MLKILIILYAQLIHHNLYPQKINVKRIILLTLFPSFFISATASINLEYLNPFYKGEISSYDYTDYFNDLINFNIDFKSTIIFIICYLILSYLFIYKLLKQIIKYIKEDKKKSEIVKLVINDYFAFNNKKIFRIK